MWASEEEYDTSHTFMEMMVARVMVIMMQIMTMMIVIVRPILLVLSITDHPHERPPLLPQRVAVARRHCSLNGSPTGVPAGRQGEQTLAKNFSYWDGEKVFCHCTLNVYVTKKNRRIFTAHYSFAYKY